MRNAIVNAAELVCYDTIKDAIISHNLMSDSVPCHFVSGFGAGFIATLVVSPVDVVKTRFMNAPLGQYTGATDAAIKMFKVGGAKAFYKGCVFFKCPFPCFVDWERHKNASNNNFNL